MLLPICLCKGARQGPLANPYSLTNWWDSAASVFKVGKDKKNLVIQFVTFFCPLVGGHLTFEFGSLNQPKKVKKTCQEDDFRKFSNIHLESRTFPRPENQEFVEGCFFHLGRWGCSRGML